MINRVLIRIKVVQMLYSYLISDSSFSIEQPAENQTREKRFAYQAYLDMLVLMVRIAGKIKKRGGHSPLEETRFIQTLEADDKISALLHRNAMSDFPVDSIAERLAEKIKESAIYRNYLKEEEQNNRIWADIFKHYIIEDPMLTEVFSRRENYTLHGMERARQMMENTFTRFYVSSVDIAAAKKDLNHSLAKSRELYLRLLTLPCAITRQRELDIDENRHKYIRTAEDENPNLRFVDNKLVALLNADDRLQMLRDNDNSLNWLPEDTRVVKSLLKSIMQSETYRDYMELQGATTLEQDAELWRELYKKVIFNNEDFLSELEDKSVFWNDDIDIIGEFLLKTLKRYGAAGQDENGLVVSQLMPMYKDEEDSQFGARLFEAALRNRVEYRHLINDAVKGKSWDADRLAIMDVVILTTALAEILNFPNIPVQVSVNEYIDMAKCYSTPKSGNFVNGLLGSIISKLKEEGKLIK